MSLPATDGLTEDQKYDRRTALRGRLQAVRSTQGALRFLDVTGDAGELARVGEDGTTLLEEFEPVLETSGDMLDLDERQQHRLVKRVRRFPLLKKPDWGLVGSRDTTPPYSTMDRPDALAAVFELFSVPRARTLITEARQLLGHVLRDPDYVQGLLDQLRDSPAPERPALIVALGLLGECPGFDEAVVKSADADVVRAWVLANSLAEWDEAEAQLEGLASKLEGPARRGRRAGPPSSSRRLPALSDRVIIPAHFHGDQHIGAADVRFDAVTSGRARSFAGDRFPIYGGSSDGFGLDLSCRSGPVETLVV